MQGAYQRVSDEIFMKINVMDSQLAKVKEIADQIEDAKEPNLPDNRRAEFVVLWDGLIAAAQQIENDICVLLLVYAEKDGAPTDKTPASAGLRHFILNAHHAAARDTVSFNVFTHVLIAIVIVSGLFGLIFGFDPAANDTRDVSFVLNYVVTAVMTYSFASIIALTFRQLTIDTTWSNAYREHWIKGLVQLVIVFLLATGVSFVSLCVWNIYVSVQTAGNIVIVDRWDQVLYGAVRQEWGPAIQGGIFAVFLVLGMDYWDSGATADGERDRPSGVGPALIGGLVLGIWAAAVRMIVAWQNGAAIDPSQMVQKAFLAFLIGVICGAVVQATLASVYIRPMTTWPTREPGPRRGKNFEKGAV